LPIPLVEPSERETLSRIRRRVRALEGVKECVDVRMTFTRKKPHVHVHVSLKDYPDYDGMHKTSAIIDHEVRKVVPNARVSIRSDPGEGGGEAERIWELVKRIAEGEPGSRGAHNIHIQNFGGKLGVDFHLEVASGMSVGQAHEVATRIERKLKAANPTISEVVTHEETVSDLMSNERSGHGTELRWYIEHVAKRFPEIKLASPPIIRQLSDNQLHVIIRAAFSPDLSLEKASQIASRLDAAIKQGFPAIVRVDITKEPVEGASGLLSTNLARS
jgi:divalent metal cation (Fe/Co/Zn/Cd) transporter